jgi:hemerythrin-like domain-containing protein
MHPIQRQLRNDHHHLQLVLNCFSKEIDCFDFNAQQDPDMEVILNALDYVREYPDKWHHPAEDVIFNQLLAKNVKESKLIKKLEEEHNKISQETEKINQLFRAAAEDCIVPASDLVESARRYITLQRTHLEQENEIIYPLMDKLFGPDDWKEIEKKIEIQNDPLFNKPSKREFTQLYHHILELEKEREKES